MPIRRLTNRSGPSRTAMAAVVAVLALAAAGCANSSSTVATVNGERIERTDVVALRTSYQDAASTDGETFRQDLTGLIIQQAMIDAARDQFGIEITPTEIADRVTDPPDRYRPVFEAISEDPEAGPGLAEANAVRSLISDAVVGRLVLDAFGGADGLLATSPHDVTQVCARHILTATPEEAEDVIARLDAGEEFADLVAEVSLDPSSPGGLLAGPDGCPVHLTPLGVEFAVAAATAPIGEPAGPLATEFGFHVIVVDERVAPTAEELETDLAAYYDPNAGSAFFTSWFNDAVRGAEIEVASAAGSWSTTGIGILPPGSADPAADAGGGSGIPPVDEIPDS